MGIPATAGGGAAGGKQLATPVQRLLAYLIDFGIMLGVVVVLMIVGGLAAKILGSTIGSLVGLVLALVEIAVAIGLFIYLPAYDNPYTQRGQSLGKKFQGIKIVKDDGSEFGLTDVLLRNVVGYMVSSFVLYLGFIWILIDTAERKGWHDKIAKTSVVVA